VRVFISSVVTGYGPFRDAAAGAVKVLRHEPLRSEDYSASPASPQQTCLQGVRDADVTIVLLGARYGEVQSSGMSATHEEYLEARSHKTAIVLMQSGATFEPRQARLLADIRTWSGGLVETFDSPADLRDLVIRVLRDCELHRTESRVDDDVLLARAKGMVPATGSGVTAAIAVAVVPGPASQLVRPADLDAFGVEIRREALTGPAAILDPAVGAELEVREYVIVRQPRAVTRIAVDAAGAFMAMQPVLAPRSIGSGVIAIIEEDVHGQIERALHLADRVLDYADKLHRSSDLVIVSGLVGGSMWPWRTRSEHQASPNVASLGLGARTLGAETVYANLTPPRIPRGDLAHRRSEIAADLIAILRRQVKP
jgi:hypothetical protein